MRTGDFRFVVKALCAAALLIGSGLPALAGEWPQFLGPTRNNISDEKNLATTLPAGGPEVVWSATVGRGFGGAAVEGGKVYLLDRDGDKRDVLRCLDFATGKEEWTFAYDAPGKVQYEGSRSTPAVDDQRVYIIGSFGDFHCLDKKTHEVVWKTHLLKDFGGALPNWAVGQSPLLYKDMVVMAPQGKKAGVVAFEKATGKVVWQTKQFGAMCYDSPMLAKIDGVEMILALAAASANASTVAAIDPAKGDILWTFKGWGKQFPIPGPTDLGKGRILLSGEYGAGLVLLHVAKGDDGKFTPSVVFDLSKKTTMASQIHQPFLVGDCLYFVSNGFDRADGLVCMDLEGKVKWKTGRKPNFDLGASLLADGKLFLLDGKTGELRIVQPDPEGYKELASAKVLEKGQFWGPIVLSDGKLLVRDQATLKCLDVRAKK